jgi:hypothetical protein
MDMAGGDGREGGAAQMLLPPAGLAPQKIKVIGTHHSQRKQLLFTIAMSGNDRQHQQACGLTQSQFNFLQRNYPGFVPNPSRVNTYSDPLQNVADRNWQDKLREDSRYDWSRDDQKSYSRNSGYGPHNYNWDPKVFP